MCFCDPLQAAGRERPKSHGGLHMLSRAVVEKCDTHRRPERRLPNSLGCCAFRKTSFSKCVTVAGGRSDGFQIPGRVVRFGKHVFRNVRQLQAASTPHFHIRGRVVDIERVAFVDSLPCLSENEAFAWEVCIIIARTKS